MPHRPARHKNTSCVLAYVRPSHIPGKFADDLLGVVLHDAGNQRYLGGPGAGSIAMQSSPRIAEARSQIVDTFLTAPQFKEAEWLWWLDADAAFEPDTLSRLMDQAHATERPIVGALAFGGANPDNMFPTVYSLEPPPDGGKGWGMDRITDYPRDALVKVGATGCHCVIVHRQVFVAMQAANARRENPSVYPWYAEGMVNSRTGAPIGEDVFFCLSAQALGIPVHVDTSIKVGHCKEVVLTEELFDQMRRVWAEKEPTGLFRIDGRSGAMEKMGDLTDAEVQEFAIK